MAVYFLGLNFAEPKSPRVCWFLDIGTRQFTGQHLRVHGCHFLWLRKRSNDGGLDSNGHLSHISYSKRELSLRKERSPTITLFGSQLVLLEITSFPLTSIVRRTPKQGVIALTEPDIVYLLDYCGCSTLASTPHESLLAILAEITS